MSVRFLNNNASNNTDVAAKTFPLLTSSIRPLTPWVRNPSWPACEANAGDNRVRGLYAVWPDGANFIAIQAQSAYTVDFGDGTINNYANSAQANYEYSYSAAALVGTEAPVTFTDIGDLVTRTAHGYTDNMRVRFFNITTTTGIVNAQFYFVINATADTFQVSATAGGSAIALTNNGTGQLLPYRVATVTITPQVSNALNRVDLFVKHNQAGLIDGYVTGWLDLAYAASTITVLILGSSSTTVRHNYLERVRLNQLGSITSFASLFQSLRELQNIEIASTITTAQSTSNMFADCSTLQTVPFFDVSQVVSMTNMFNGCTSLQIVPLFNIRTTGSLSMTGMFTGCSSLQTVPLFNTVTVTSMSSMFSSCPSLQEVPLFNTAAVTNMNAMFNACRSLQTVPLFNTSLVLDMNQMFSDCSSLKTVPLFNTAAALSMSSMFANCLSLQTVPSFNMPSATDISSMFQGCRNLQAVPLLNIRTASSVNMSNFFNFCSSLQTVPLFNTVTVTSMSNMFANCSSLQTIPLFNTVAVTNMSGMFSGCISLNSIPALVTTAVISSGNFNNMISSCNSLSRIEARNFRFTFSITNCKLSATALNEIYTNLPSVSGQTITVTGNYGTATDNPSIATAKGWTVSG